MAILINLASPIVADLVGSRGRHNYTLSQPARRSISAVRIADDRTEYSLQVLQQKYLSTFTAVVYLGDVS